MKRFNFSECKMLQCFAYRQIESFKNYTLLHWFPKSRVREKNVSIWFFKMSNTMPLPPHNLLHPFWSSQHGDKKP